MAMQYCLDCKEPASQGAYHCPNCRRLTSYGAFIFVIRVALLGVIAWNLFWHQPF